MFSSVSHSPLLSRPSPPSPSPFPPSLILSLSLSLSLSCRRLLFSFLLTCLSLFFTAASHARGIPRQFSDGRFIRRWSLKPLSFRLHRKHEHFLAAQAPHNAHLFAHRAISEIKKRHRSKTRADWNDTFFGGLCDKLAKIFIRLRAYQLIRLHEKNLIARNIRLSRRIEFPLANESRRIYVTSALHGHRDEKIAEQR